MVTFREMVLPRLFRAFGRAEQVRGAVVEMAATVAEVAWWAVRALRDRVRR